MKINLKGVNKVMRSPGVQKVVDEQAHRIKNRAGDGYEAYSKPHRWVARAYVFTKTREAAEDQRDNYTLQRSLGG